MLADPIDIEYRLYRIKICVVEERQNLPTDWTEEPRDFFCDIRKNVIFL